MPKSQKPRHQKRRRVPSDLSRQGMEIVKPGHTIERVARTWIRNAALIVRSCFDKGVQGQIALGLRSGQSMTKKVERLRAVVLEKTVAEFHSARHMNAMGLGLVACQCGPGVGHNAPPQTPQR